MSLGRRRRLTSVVTITYSSEAIETNGKFLMLFASSLRVSALLNVTYACSTPMQMSGCRDGVISDGPPRQKLKQSG